MKKSLPHRSLPFVFIPLSTSPSIPGPPSQKPWWPISIWEKTGTNSRTCPCCVFNHLSRRMRVSTCPHIPQMHTQMYTHHLTWTLDLHSCLSMPCYPLTHLHWNPGQAELLPLPHSMSSQLPSPVFVDTTVFIQHNPFSSPTDSKVHQTFILSFLRHPH